MDSVPPALASRRERPRRGPRVIDRRRLLDELDRTFELGLGLVSAAAGAGKSTLLGSWADRLRDVHVAWVTCRSEHGDPLILAVDIGAAVAPAVEVSPGTSLSGLVDALVRECASSSTVVLILDDVHELQAPEVLGPLDRLVRTRPSGLTLVLSGREDPALPWHRTRLQGLVELRGSDLAFEVSEAHELLTHVSATAVPEEYAAELCRLTEGWAVGLCLAALAIRGAPDERPAVRLDPGRAASVRRYLENEVLAGLTPDQVRFLEVTSVLEALDPELCDLLTGREDSAQVLEQLVEANLFTDRVADAPPRFRHHAVFAAFLRDRLDPTGHADPAELLTTASRWHEARGELDLAIRYALRAEDVEGAERVIRAGCGPALRAGRAATVVRWVRSLPEEAIERSPELSLVLARASIAQGDFLVARAGIATATRALARRPEPWLRLGRLYVASLVHLVEGDLGRLVGESEEALQLFADTEQRPELALLGIDEEGLLTYGAVASILTGDLDRSVAITDRVLTPARLSHPSKATVLAVGIRALAAAWAGDRPRALECLEAGRDVVTGYVGSTGDPLPFEVAAAWTSDGAPDAPGLAAVRRIVQELRFPLYRLLLALAETKLALDGDRTAAAADTLAEADEVIATMPDAAHLAVLAAQLRLELSAAEHPGTGDDLHPREIEVLAEIATGASRQEAARNLHLSVNTVKTYLRTAYRKLGATDRDDAVRRARALRVIEPLPATTGGTASGPDAR